MKSHRELPSGRAKLAAVIGDAGDVVLIEDAAETLELSRTEAAKLLSRWTQQGWFRRVGPGAYVPVQLDLLTSEQVVDDAWLLVPALFAPAYIGGRTAAEHWDLTEQIFRDILVFTARPVRGKTKETAGVIFALKHTTEEMIFGTRTVWRGRSRIAVSDPHRTIIDMLGDPGIGGGIQHVSDCFDRYLRKADSDPDRLIEYAGRISNGAIFKRLGFLAERHPSGTSLVAACRSHLTKGHAKLDPALKCPRLVTRWSLRIPESWSDDR